MSYCLAGAVVKYKRGDAFLGRFLRVAQEILHIHPITWNDQSGRTQAEVVALVKEVEELVGVVDD